MKIPTMSRRTAFAATTMVIGLAVIALALVGGSNSPGGNTAASSADRKIDPVGPINPDDNDARKLGGEEDGIDSITPFADSFGTSGRRKVTVSVSGNGYVSIGLHFRDRKKPRVFAARTFTVTRTVKGRFPLAAVVLQLPDKKNITGAATRATCRIVIDGTEVSKESLTQRSKLKACVA